MEKRQNPAVRVLAMALSACMLTAYALTPVTAQDFEEVGEEQTSTDSTGQDYGNFDTTPADSGTPEISYESDSAMSNHEIENFGYEFGVEGNSDELYINEDFQLGDIHNPRPSATTLNGIDISNWQSTINLDAVQADFVICKATGGINYADRMFRTFADKTLSQGRLLGFYHFAHDNDSTATPEEEANFFYQQTKDYIGKGIPILDFEASDLLHYDGGDSAVGGSGWALRFLEAYYTLSGVRPLLYTSIHYARTLDWNQVADKGYQLWVAQYLENKDQDGYRPTEDTNTDCYGTGAFNYYYMHQYTSRGHLPGYDGNLDLNKFYGNADDWRALAQIDPNRDMMDMYRLYNMYTGEHFYTSSHHERDVCIANGWIDEDKAWQAPKVGNDVYRLCNPNTGDHHFTTDSYEKDTLVALGWNYEGIGWKSASNKSRYPVYRLYNPNAQTGTHHYTMSREEVQALVSLGWHDEGTAWYAYDGLADESEVLLETQEFLEQTSDLLGNIVKAELENREYENK